MVAGMLMPLRDLRAIYEVLFRDGVMVAKKDKRPQTKHPEIEGVSNLQVIRAMGSLKSRGCVKETFAWRHFYWYLTNEGIVYLRDYLRLPPEIVPASLQRVRRPAATLAIAHRAARVQSVEGPTSYVPKPGRRGEAESQEALAERQGYRHKMMGSGERESYSDRTPRFRGRPMAAEPVRPKASWEVEDQPSHSQLRKGNSFRSEAVVMEESRVKSVSQQWSDVSSEKPATASQGKKVSEVYKEKAPISAQAQRPASKQDVSQTTLTSLSSKTALPLTVAAVAEATGVATSKAPAESSTPKSNKEKISSEKTSMKSSKMVVGNSTSASLVDKEIKKEKPESTVVDPVKSAEVRAEAEIATDKVKPQAVITMAASQETSNLLTGNATPVITAPVNKDVKEEKPKRAKITEESVKPAEMKTHVESKKDQEKANEIATQSTKPPPDGSTSQPELPTQEFTDAKVTSVNLSAKPISHEMPQKTTTVVESSILEVKTTTTTLSTPMANAEDAKPVKGKAVITEMVTKQEKTDVKVIPHIKKEEKRMSNETLKISVQDPVLVQKDSSSPLLSQNSATTEGVMETKQVVEGSSRSKKKKKKTPGESIKGEDLPDSKLEKEKTFTDKPPEEAAKKILEPTPVITSDSLAMSTSKKNEEASPVEETKTQAETGIDGGKIQEVPQTDEKPIMQVSKQTVEKSISEVASPPPAQISPVPPVGLPDVAGVKEKVETSSFSEITQEPLCTKDKLNADSPHMEPVKSEEITVTKVETVTVQKMTQVELKQASPKPKEKSPAPQSEFQKPTVETKFLTSTGKADEELSKGKKKGKGKKQAEAPVSDTIDTKPISLPGAEALLSTNITSLPKASVKDSPVMASEPTEMNAFPKMTPERMCGEETRQAAAVFSEAPADKEEVESTLLFAEKIKREVPKPKTSSAVRETHAAGELASPAPVGAAEAVVAQEQSNPLTKQEEPPKVAQHSDSQAAERSTEKRLSVSEASKQEETKKRDLEEDTPSATATALPVAAQPDQPHLGDTCESENPELDEAAMKRKIVVVEEIVEVKQAISPQASGEQPPPPVQPEVEEEELDLDVLEALAVERALLSGAAGAKVQGASPEEDWDHSLEEPEEKTWPNFIEGLFERVPINPLPVLSYTLMHVM